MVRCCWRSRPMTDGLERGSAPWVPCTGLCPGPFLPLAVVDERDDALWSVRLQPAGKCDVAPADDDAGVTNIQVAKHDWLDAQSLPAHQTTNELHLFLTVADRAPATILLLVAESEQSAGLGILSSGDGGERRADGSLGLGDRGETLRG